MVRCLKIPALLFITLFLTSLYSIGWAAELKVGYIRPQYIFSKFPPYQEAQKQVDAYQKQELDKLQKNSQDYQNKVKEANQNAILMTEEIKKTKTEELQKIKESLDADYQELYKTGGKLESKQKELLTPVIDKINAAITRLGKDEGYDYILDAEGPVLYANQKYDLTDMVLKELEKEIPKK
jgi:outer membrane protein